MSKLRAFNTHNILLCMALSVLLLGAQFANAAHSVDHLFHKASQSCDAYSAFEHSHSIVGDSNLSLLSFDSFLPTLLEASFVVSNSSTYFSIRAPPHHSFS